MTSLVISIVVSLVCGCLTALAEKEASRILNPAAVGGALFYTVAVLLALGASLASMALVRAFLGNYSHATNSVTLASYAIGFVLFSLVERAGSSRQS
jgi:hypothetical protein